MPAVTGDQTTATNSPPIEHRRRRRRTFSGYLRTDRRQDARRGSPARVVIVFRPCGCSAADVRRTAAVWRPCGRHGGDGDARLGAQPQRPTGGTLRSFQGESVATDNLFFSHGHTAISQLIVLSECAAKVRPAWTAASPQTAHGLSKRNALAGKYLIETLYGFFHDKRSRFLPLSLLSFLALRVYQAVIGTRS